MDAKPMLAKNLARIVTVMLLAAPALMSFVGPRQVSGENRTLAPLPARPASWEALLKYPAQLDLWINDHFGFRDTLVALNNRIRHTLFHQFPTIQVIEGRNGRIFLSAHAITQEPYSAILLSCGYRFTRGDAIVDQLNRFSSALHGAGVKARLMIAPSAPVLYRDELPEWLERQCPPGADPISRVIAAPGLQPAARSMVYYPLEAMLQMKRDVDVIPKTWFHWAGAGPRLVARTSVAELWHRDPREGIPIPVEKKPLPSDISHLFPGIALPSEVETADFPAAGIEQCLGARCFPEMPAIMEKLGDVSRYRNKRLPSGRLVLFSDSFGYHIAGWYSSYYREVIHISTNSLERLDRAEIEQLRQAFLHRGQQDDVLFLYHDVSILFGRLAKDVQMLFP
jgi:hypothetical protein